MEKQNSSKLVFLLNIILIGALCAYALNQKRFEIYFHLLHFGIVPYYGTRLIDPDDIGSDILPDESEQIALLYKNLGRTGGAQPPPFTAADRCAIVGSSSKLRGSSMGTHIDSHTKVLRINEAPTIGFEKDVGTKTNVRYVNAWRMPPAEEDRTNVVLILAYHSYSDLTSIVDHAAKGDYSGFRSVHLLPYHLSRWASSMIKLGVSSGVVATFLAIKECGSVDVYGMGPGIDDMWSHYFKKRDAILTYHSSDLEALLFEQLAAGRLISFH